MILERVQVPSIVQHIHSRFRAPAARWQQEEGICYDCSTLIEGNPTLLGFHAKKSS